MSQLIEQSEEQIRDEITRKIEGVAESLSADDVVEVTQSVLRLLEDRVLLDESTLQRVFDQVEPRLPSVMRQVMDRSVVGQQISMADALRIRQYDPRSRASVARERENIMKVLKFAASDRADDANALQALQTMLMYKDNIHAQDNVSLVVEKAFMSVIDAKNVLLKERVAKLKSTLPVQWGAIAHRASTSITQDRATVKRLDQFVTVSRDVSAIFGLPPSSLEGYGSKQTISADNIDTILNLPEIGGVNNYLRPYIIAGDRPRAAIVSLKDYREMKEQLVASITAGDGSLPPLVQSTVERAFPAQPELWGYLFSAVRVLTSAGSQELLEQFLGMLSSNKGLTKGNGMQNFRDTLVTLMQVDDQNPFNVPGGFTNLTMRRETLMVQPIPLGSNITVFRATDVRVPPTYYPGFKMTGVDEISIQLSRAYLKTLSDKTRLFNQILDVAGTHYYGSEFTGWIKRLNSLYASKSLNQSRPAYLNSRFLGEKYQVDSILNYFTYLGSSRFGEILGLIKDKAPDRWDEALSERIEYGEDIDDVPDHLANVVKLDSKTMQYYILQPRFPYNQVNFKSGAGFPYGNEKKKLCIGDVAMRASAIWHSIQNNAQYNEVLHRNPDLILVQPKPKKEVYPLGGRIEKGDDNIFMRLARTAKTRTIFNVPFLAGYAAQKFFNLASNSQPTCFTPYRVGDQIEYVRMKTPLFSIHGFSPAHGNVDLLLRRIQQIHPFSTMSSDYAAFGYSDNGYLSGVLSAAYSVKRSELQFATIQLQGVFDGDNDVVTLPAGTRVLISADGQRCESSTTRAFATRVITAYLLTLGVTQEDESTSTLFKYIMYTLLPVACGAVGVIGETQFELPFNTSGNPLTFTFNDVLLYQILNEYTNQVLSEPGIGKIDVERFLSLAHEFGVTLTIERVTILEPRGSFFSSEVGREIEVDLLGFSVVARSPGTTFFNDEGDDAPDAFIMVPMLERARMIKQFLFTKSDSKDDKEKDEALRCMRYFSLLFSGGIYDPFWVNLTIPYMLEHSNFISYMAPNVSSEYTEEDDLLVGVFNETYKVNRSIFRSLLDDFSSQLTGLQVQEDSKEAQLALYRDFGQRFEKLVFTKVQYLYAYDRESVVLTDPESGIVDGSIAIAFEKSLRSFDLDSKVVSGHVYASLDKTHGSLAKMLDLRVQEFLRKHSIDGRFKLSGNNLVEKIDFDAESLQKMSDFFDTFKDKIKGDKVDRNLPFFKDRVRKYVVLEPSLLKEGYKGYQSIMAEQARIKAARQKELDESNKARKLIQEQTRTASITAQKAYTEERKRLNREALADTTKYMSLSEINQSVKPMMGVSQQQMIKSAIKAASRGGGKLTSADIDQIKHDEKSRLSVKERERVEVTYVVGASNSVSNFSEGLFDHSCVSLRSTVKNTPRLKSDFTGVRNRAISTLLAQFVTPIMNVFNNILDLKDRYLAWLARVECGYLLSRYESGTLGKAIRPVLTDFEQFQPTLLGMIEFTQAYYDKLRDRIDEYDFDEGGKEPKEKLRTLLEMLPPVKYSIFTDLRVVAGATVHLNGLPGPSIDDTFNNDDDEQLKMPVVAKNYQYILARNESGEEYSQFDILQKLSERSVKAFAGTLNYLGVPRKNLDPDEYNDSNPSMTILNSLTEAIWQAYANELVGVNRMEIPIVFCGEPGLLSDEPRSLKRLTGNAISFDPRSVYSYFNDD